MDVTTVAISLGCTGIGCACAALGALVTRWISAREIRCLRSANRELKTILKSNREQLDRVSGSFRGAFTDNANLRLENKRLEKENAELRSDLKGAVLRVEIRDKMRGKNL